MFDFDAVPSRWSGTPSKLVVNFKSDTQALNFFMDQLAMHVPNNKAYAVYSNTTPINQYTKGDMYLRGPNEEYCRVVYEIYYSKKITLCLGLTQTLFG